MATWDCKNRRRPAEFAEEIAKRCVIPGVVVLDSRRDDHAHRPLVRIDRLRQSRSRKPRSPIDPHDEPVDAGHEPRRQRPAVAADVLERHGPPTREVSRKLDMARGWRANLDRRVAVDQAY